MFNLHWTSSLPCYRFLLTSRKMMHTRLCLYVTTTFSSLITDILCCTRIVQCRMIYKNYDDTKQFHFVVVLLHIIPHSDYFVMLCTDITTVSCKWCTLYTMSLVLVTQTFNTDPNGIRFFLKEDFTIEFNALGEINLNTYIIYLQKLTYIFRS